MAVSSPGTFKCSESSPSGLSSGDQALGRREDAELAEPPCGRGKTSAQKRNRVWGEELGGLWGKTFSHASPLIGSLLSSCFEKTRGKYCKTQTKGDVFPLPTSTDQLMGVVTERPVLVELVRNVCMGLNSYAGVDGEYEGTLSATQRELLKDLVEVISDAGDWKEEFKPMSWEDFFRLRSVDYVGDEVAVARITSWNNLKHALPSEVGSVALEEVVGEGCKHYVQHFDDYLLDEASRTYTRPPRVMIPAMMGPPSCPTCK
eukprot:s1425_g6.t1